MARTVLMALGLIGLAACGGGHAKAKPKAAVARSTSSATSHQQASRAARKGKASSRADTTTQKNPLTNH